MLTGAPWLTDGTYSFTIEDYICSMLVESPDDYFLEPSQQVLLVFLPGRGLVRIIHDFRGMDDDQINRIIHIVLHGG